jgi:hypothetical protein
MAPRIGRNRATRDAKHTAPQRLVAQHPGFTGNGLPVAARCMSRRESFLGVFFRSAGAVSWCAAASARAASARACFSRR